MFFARYEREVIAIKINDPALVELLQRYGPVRSLHQSLNTELCEQMLHLLLRIREWIRLF